MTNDDNKKQIVVIGPGSGPILGLLGKSLDGTYDVVYALSNKQQQPLFQGREIVTTPKGNQYPRPKIRHNKGHRNGRK